MKTYDPNEFIRALAQHTNNRSVPQCPYCGGQQFTTTDSLASILIGKEPNGIAIGPFIPAGMIICQKCGHIEFFALGALGLMDNGDEKRNGEQK